MIKRIFRTSRRLIGVEDLLPATSLHSQIRGLSILNQKKSQQDTRKPYMKGAVCNVEKFTLFALLRHTHTQKMPSYRTSHTTV